MARKFAVLLLFALLSVAASGQEAAACSILLTTRLDGGVSLALYGRDGAQFDQRVDFAITGGATAVVSTPSSGVVRAAVVTPNKNSASVTLQFLTVLPSRLDIGGQAILENATPRAGGWSPSGRYLALRGSGDALSFYDTDNGAILPFAPDKPVYALAWSPTADIFAFVGEAEDRGGFAVYAADPDGTIRYSTPVEAATFARLGWLSATQLAVTACDDGQCRTTAADVADGSTSALDLGANVPESYVPWRDSYFLSALTGDAVNIRAANGAIRPYTSGERVVSRPLTTRDGRYFSVRTDSGGGQYLLILDMYDSKVRYRLPLQDAPPALLSAPETWSGLYPPLFAFDAWNSREHLLAYANNGATRIFDAVDGADLAVIDRIGAPQWVCG